MYSVSFQINPVVVQEGDIMSPLYFILILVRDIIKVSSGLSYLGTYKSRGSGG